MTATDPLDHVRAHNPHAGQGAVMLDIGGGIGALMISMPDSMLGEEVDIEAVDPAVDADLRREHGHAHHRPHVAVLPRPVPGGGVLPSLVYPALPAGEYRLYLKGEDEVVMVVGVLDGRVTTEEWPG